MNGEKIVLISELTRPPNVCRTLLRIDTIVQKTVSTLSAGKVSVYDSMVTTEILYTLYGTVQPDMVLCGWRQQTCEVNRLTVDNDKGDHAHQLLGLEPLAPAEVLVRVRAQ